MRVDSCTDIPYVPDRLKSKIRPHSIILHLAYIRAFLTRIIYLGLGVAIQQDECFQALLLPIQSKVSISYLILESVFSLIGS